MMATYDAEQHLHARVDHLEHQLAFHRQLVAQNNSVLVDVYTVLQECADTVAGAPDYVDQLAGLMRRVRSLSDRQRIALKGEPEQRQQRQEEDSTDSRPAWLSPSSSFRESADGPLVGDGTASSLSDAADAAAGRLLRASGRLAAAWVQTLGWRVSDMLRTPDEAFDAFHDAPTDDALQHFFRCYRESQQSIRTELGVATSPTDESGTDLTPTDRLVAASPFGSDNSSATKVRGLYRDALVECAKAASTSASNVPREEEPQLRRPVPLTAPTSGIDGGYRGTEAPMPAARRPPLQPRAVQPSAGEGSVVKPIVVPLDGSPTLPTHQPQPVTSHARRSASAGVGHRPSSAAAGSGTSTPRHANATSTDSPFFRQDAGGGFPPGRMATVVPGRTSAPTATPRDARAAPQTPSRFGRVSHDSAQMQNLLGGTSTATRRPVTEESPDVLRLKQQLAQLEMQVGLSAGRHGGANSGSDARHFALNKRVQHVRAELIKAQREEAEINAVQAAVEEQRRQRHVDRTTFGR